MAPAPQPTSLDTTAAARITAVSSNVERSRNTEISSFRPMPTRKNGTSSSVVPCTNVWTRRVTLSPRPMPEYIASTERLNSSTMDRWNCPSLAWSFDSMAGRACLSAREPHFASTTMKTIGSTAVRMISTA